MTIKNRDLLQHIIDTSDVVLEKKQEATEYLAQLEAAATAARKIQGVKNSTWVALAKALNALEAEKKG